MNSIDEDPESVCNRAIQSLDDGNIVEAQRLIDLPAMTTSTDNHIQRERSKILALFGRTTESLDSINKVLATEPKDWLSLIYRACFYESMGKNEEAIADIAAAKSNYSYGDIGESLKKQAASSYKSGQYTYAYFFYNALVLLNEDEDNVPVEMVLSLMAMRLYEIAKQALFVKILYDRKNDLGWFHYEDFIALTEIELSTSKYSEALRSIATIEGYFDYDPDATPVIQFKEEEDATEEEKKEHTEMMIAMWRELQYLRGLCEFNLSNYQNSVQHLENSLSGKCALGHELYGMDGKAYRIIQAKRRDYIAIERMRSEALLRIGETNATISSLSKILENNTNDREALYQRGVAYIQLDEYGEALKNLVKAKSLGYEKAQIELDNISRITNRLDINKVVDSDHPYVFQRNGDIWLLRFDGGDIFTLKNAVGLQYIKMLLMNKNTQFHPSNMIANINSEMIIEKSNEYDPDNIQYETKKNIDNKAMQAYRGHFKKLLEKKEELEMNPEATDFNLNMEEVDNEIEEIKKQLFAGKFHMMNADDKKTATAVKNAMDRSIEKISKQDATFGKHLKDCIETGLKIFYHPPDQISWLV